MEQIGLAILRDYGLFGLLVVFLMAAYWLQHKSAVRKDELAAEISKEFTTSLKENTAAIHKSSEAMIKLADASENLVAGFDRHAEQNRDEHAKILDYVARRR